MRIVPLGLIALGIALAAPLSAQKLLQNDSIPPSLATVVIQKGFIQGDIGAATFAPNASEYPVKLLEVQVLMKDTFNSTAQRIYVLHVYPTATPPATPVYSLGVALREGGFNKIDLRAQNIVLNGPFTVGMEVFDTPQPAEPNLCTDADGCQNGKNWIFDINTRLWFPGCLLGLRGDLAIRALVDTNYGASANVTTASTPRAGSTVVLNLSVPNGGAQLPYQAASSFSSSGLPLGTRTIPLGLDGLLWISLFSPAPIFANYSGTLDSVGNGIALINLPNIPGIVGAKFYTAFLTLDPPSPNGVKHISTALPLTIVP